MDIVLIRLVVATTDEMHKLRPLHQIEGPLWVKGGGAGLRHGRFSLDCGSARALA